MLDYSLGCIRVPQLNLLSGVSVGVTSQSVSACRAAGPHRHAVPFNLVGGSQLKATSQSTARERIALPIFFVALSHKITTKAIRHQHRAGHNPDAMLPFYDAPAMPSCWIPVSRALCPALRMGCQEAELCFTSTPLGHDQRAPCRANPVDQHCSFSLPVLAFLLLPNCGTAALFTQQDNRLWARQSPLAKSAATSPHQVSSRSSFDV